MVRQHRYLKDKRDTKESDEKEKEKIKGVEWETDLICRILTVSSWQTNSSELPGCDWVLQRNIFLKCRGVTEMKERLQQNKYVCYFCH